MKFLKTVFLITCLTLFSSGLLAASIRGQVATENPYSGLIKPVPGASVELFSKNPETGRWIQHGSYRTGYDGMYYFQDIRPGNYVLRINGDATYPVSVSERENQDIPRIILDR